MKGTPPWRTKDEVRRYYRFHNEDINVSDTTAIPGRPFRVLCLDGGGMRGIYTASYISHLAQGFSAKRGVGPLDVGSGFNLIVGTSTGAIIGCALAAGIPAERILRL